MQEEQQQQHGSGKLHEHGGHGDSGRPRFGMREFLFQDDEAIYGLGQYRGGVMNWRGHVAELKQENTGTAVPVFVSTKGYGVLWDNSSFTRFVDKQQTFISSELGDALNYYFFYGPKIDDVIAGYREVTGAAPMFPKWAFFGDLRMPTSPDPCKNFCVRHPARDKSPFCFSKDLRPWIDSRDSGTFMISCPPQYAKKK